MQRPPQPMQHEALASVAPSTTKPRSDSLPPLQQARDLVAQLLAVPAPDTEAPEGSAAAEDRTPEALAFAFRLWLLLTRAPSAEAQAVVDGAYSRPLARHLLRLVAGGHELSFLFVRLLAVLATSSGCGAALADPAFSVDGDAVPVLAGLLRLSGAPLMTAELVDLLAELVGAAGDDEVRYAEETKARAPLARSSSRTTSSPLAQAAQLRFLQRCESRSLFIAAFLTRGGRNTLLLVKHLGDSALSEHTRCVILRTLYSLACGSSYGPPTLRPTISLATSSAREQARRMLLQSAEKWSERVLPALSVVDAADPNAQSVRAELESSRRHQVRVIGDLRSVLSVCASASAPTNR